MFENRLKKQTKHTIAELNGAKLRLLMITGMFRTPEGVDDTVKQVKLNTFKG